MPVDFKSVLKTGILILGFSTVSVQIIFLREFLSVFGGNELVIGMFLSGWMLLTGLGAWAGKLRIRKIRGSEMIAIPMLILSLSPAILFYLLYSAKALLLQAGEAAPPLMIWLFGLILLSPFCLFSGFLFTSFSGKYSQMIAGNSVRLVYGWESIGSLAGGLVYNFILVFVMNSLQALLLNSLLIFLFLSHYLLRKVTLKWTASFVFLLLGVLVVFKSTEFYKEIINFTYPGQELLDSHETPFGRIDVTRSDQRQINFYENGDLRFVNEATIQAEEIVHFPMALHPDPDSILIISGGFTGTILEALKYDPEFILNLEVNSGLNHMIENYLDLSLPEKNVVSKYKDGRLYIKTTPEKYDVILSDIPNPSTIRLNRYFTQEYFREASEIMRDSAIFCMHLEATGSYLDDETLQLHKTIRNTLSGVFRYVMFVPAGRNYFLASNTPLSYNISGNLESSGIINEYITPQHINDELMEFSSSMLLPADEDFSEISRDSKPVAFKYYLMFWLRKHNSGLWVFFSVISAFLLFFWIFSHPYNKSLLMTGLTGISAEYIAIIIIQVLFGYSYYLSGIIITFFMAGIAAGALHIYKFFRETPGNFFAAQMILSFLIISLILILAVFEHFSHLQFLAIITIVISVVLTGVLSGIIFTWTAGLLRGNMTRIAGNTYSSDLAGSAAGVLIISVYLIPAVGINYSCLILTLVNIFNAVYVWFKTRKSVP